MSLVCTSHLLKTVIWKSKVLRLNSSDHKPPHHSFPPTLTLSPYSFKYPKSIKPVTGRKLWCSVDHSTACCDPGVRCQVELVYSPKVLHL